MVQRVAGQVPARKIKETFAKSQAYEVSLTGTATGQAALEAHTTDVKLLEVSPAVSGSQLFSDAKALAIEVGLQGLANSRSLIGFMLSELKRSASGSAKQLELPGFSIKMATYDLIVDLFHSPRPLCLLYAVS
jgi:hypothetical protein